MKFDITIVESSDKIAGVTQTQRARKQLTAINDWLNKRVATGAIDVEYLKTINRQLADIIEQLS